MSDMKFKKSSEVMENYLYKRHEQGHMWATLYLIELGLGDPDISPDGNFSR